MQQTNTRLNREPYLKTIAIVAEHFHVLPEEITSKTRIRDIAEARMVVWFLCAAIFDLTCNEIGREWGYHRSNVVHAWRKVEELAFQDDRFLLRVSRAAEELGHKYNDGEIVA